MSKGLAISIGISSYLLQLCQFYVGVAPSITSFYVTTQEIYLKQLFSQKFGQYIDTLTQISSTSGFPYSENNYQWTFCPRSSIGLNYLHEFLY